MILESYILLLSNLLSLSMANAPKSYHVKMAFGVPNQTKQVETVVNYSYLTYV